MLITIYVDENVVKGLGNKVTWYIPLGLREWFVKRGVDNVIELDWWQEIHHKDRPDILIACVPAMVSWWDNDKSGADSFYFSTVAVLSGIETSPYGVAL